MQMGACNQEKRLLEQNPCSRGNSAPSVTTGENVLSGTKDYISNLWQNFQNARFRVSQKQAKKKTP